MASAVRVLRAPDGTAVIAPVAAPVAFGVADGVPDIDVTVVEVAGGNLAWSVLDADRVPTAVLDDPDLAQGWVWALYGEPVALALAGAAGDADPAVRPGSPPLAASVDRLGYALWAQRWWPASTVDAIAPLDEGLLDREIAALVEECDLVFGAEDSADALLPAVEQDAGGPADAGGLAAGAEPGGTGGYALAAGPAPVGRAAGLVLARGSAGTDWRRCPPGLVDAAEQAVTWQVVRTAGRTEVAVGVVAAPGLAGAARPPVPAHLVPWATIGAGQGGAPAVRVALRLVDDVWQGSAVAPEFGGGAVWVDVHLPGFAPAEPPRADPAAARLRARIRDLARHRLASVSTVDGRAPGLGPARPLQAEVAAAEDEDF